MNTGLETVAAFQWLRRSMLSHGGFQDAMVASDPANADPLVLSARVAMPPFGDSVVADVVGLTVLDSKDFKNLGGEGAQFSTVLFALQVMTKEEIPDRAATIYGAIHPIIEEMFEADESAVAAGLVIECERIGGIGPLFDRDKEGKGEVTLGGTYQLRAETRVE